MRFTKYPVQSMICFFWIGFVSSISFMEAWLKFRAPHVTLSVGLSIGQLVFEMLNKMEWVFAFLIIGFLIYRNKSTPQWLFLVIPILILIVQTFWFLPELQTRVDGILAGNKLPPSLTHFYYLGLEVVKVICLLIFGILSFSDKNKEVLQNENE